MEDLWILFFQPPWSTFVKVTVEQSYGDWTRVLTGIQTQNEAGAQPGASNLNRKCLWQNKLCYCRKEPEIRNEERTFFISLVWNHKILPSLNTGKAQVSYRGLQLFRVFLSGKGVLADGALWFILSPKTLPRKHSLRTATGKTPLWGACSHPECLHT